MNKTEWKPKEEISFSLRGYEKIAVISCTVCAMFSGTGGREGLKIFRNLCREMNKKVVFLHSITPCCSEEVMSRAMKIFRKKILKADALVILSCASGVKAAFIAGPPIPVLSVLNPVGSVVVGSGHSDSELLDSVCKICGICVISYTAGICPVSGCPSRSKYQPCRKAPCGEGVCAVRPEQSCVWGRIRKLGNPEALLELKKIHEQPGLTHVQSAGLRHTNSVIRYPAGIFLSFFRFCEKCIRWIQ